MGLHLMTPTFFVTRQIPQAGLAHLAQAGTVRVNPHDRQLSTEELITLGGEAAGWITMLTDVISEALLERCPQLRAIANYAVGFNNIDIAACTRRRIGVSNTPEVLTDATAELTWALILACARRVVEADGWLRRGLWRGWQPLEFLGTQITGQVLGLIGAGRIAMRVAEMSRGFHMPIQYTARHPNPDLEKRLAARRVPLEELLAQADVISIHVPLTESTRHLLGSGQLRLLKPSAILINTARGPVVDEAALLEALRQRSFGAAGLDVYENEPRLTPGLAELPNVVLLPHLGSATTETRTRMALLAAKNLIAMVQGRRPPNPLNSQLWP